MNVTTKINILIDTHPNIAYTECEGCPQCDKIRKLADTIRTEEEKKPADKLKEDKFQRILEKGENMTTRELSMLLDHDVPLTKIMKALNMKTYVLFKEMIEPFMKQTKKVITAENYIKCRKEGMTNEEIAEKFGIETRTLHNTHIRKWKRKGEITKEQLKGLPRRARRGKSKLCEVAE